MTRYSDVLWSWYFPFKLECRRPSHMSWVIREGKYAEKLVEVASMCGIREGASTCVADGSSAHSAGKAVMGSTETKSGAGIGRWEHGWPGPMKLAMGTVAASSGEDGGRGEVTCLTPVIWWALCTNGHWSMLLSSRHVPSRTCGYTPYPCQSSYPPLDISFVHITLVLVCVPKILK